MMARDVPAVAAMLQDSLITPIYMEYLNGVVRSMNQDTPSEKVKSGRVVMDGNEMGHLLSNLLNVTPLYHVTESMTAVARHAAEKLEGDEIWLPDSWPSLNGLLVFERPLMVVDIWNRPISVAAFQWYTSVDADGRPGISTVLYADSQDARDYYNAALVYENGKDWLSVLGRFHLFEVDYMPLGAKVGTWDRSWPVDVVQDYQRTHPKPVELDGMESPTVPFGTPLSTNLGKINYMIFMFMASTIADLDEWTDKKLARRNRHKKRPPPAVTIIRLRRRDDYGYHEEGTGNWLTYRSITKGHFRRQWYGPGRKEWKKIYVHPYVRGPEDAPWHQPTRITTLER